MDYDWLSTNDFAGEAVAPLSDFCWPGRPNASPAGKSVQPVILHLSRSKPSGTYSSRLYQAPLFYTNIILASWVTRGCRCGFSNYFSNTTWKAIQSRDICVRCRNCSHLFALLSREANHEDAGRSHRRQGGSGVCPQAEGDWEVNGGGVKAVSAAPCWCFLTTSCDMCFCTGTMFTIFEFFSNVIVCSVIIPKLQEKNRDSEAVFELGNDHPVTVPPYAVSVIYWLYILEFNG